MSACRSLLTYVEEDDDYKYESNIAKKVKDYPKRQLGLMMIISFLSYEQIMKLREELIKRGKLQHAVLEMIMFDSGGRRGEIAQINKHNLLNSNKTNIVVGKKR